MKNASINGVSINGVSMLGRLLAGETFDGHEMAALVGALMDGAIQPLHQAALLVALAMRHETFEEIAGAATAMRKRAVRIPHTVPDVIDTCGTGGDGKGSFNISTAAAVVAAAAGARVAKHGNRSVSSRSGSADVLAALGVPIDLSPEAAGEALDNVGIAFLFAPKLHPAMKAVMPVRKALGVRTLFNILGPLTNPAGARRQLLGVFARRLLEPMAQALAALGSTHAMVVHGADGLDEITVTGVTHVAELRDGAVRCYDLEPRALGIELAAPERLAGGTPLENAALFSRLVGEASAAPADAARDRALSDVVALNAGAALYIAGHADDLATGLAQARAALADGRARATLRALRAVSGRGVGRRQ